MTLVSSPPPQPRRWLAAAGLVLVKLALSLPHLIVLPVLLVVELVFGYVGHWVALVIGHTPRWIRRPVEAGIEWWTRVAAWNFGLTDEYPPFDGSAPWYAIRPGFPAEHPTPRWLSGASILLARWVLGLPLILLSAVMALGAIAVKIAGEVMVIATGELPAWAYRYLTGTLQLNVRTAGFVLGLQDAYPPLELLPQ